MSSKTITSKKEKQIERSKEAVTKALIELLYEYSLESISITQLCNHAGVGRPTFYRHFESKQDVLNQQHERWFDEYLEKARVAYKENPSAETVDLVAFEFYRDQKDIVRLIKTRNLYREGLGGVAEHRRRVEKEFAMFDDKSDYARDYRIGGLIFVFSRWMAGGMKETPEQMASIFSDIYKGMRQSDNS